MQILTMVEDVKIRAYNSLVLAMRDFGLINDEEFKRYLSSANRSENELLYEAFQKNPKIFPDVIKKQVDYFIDGEKPQSDLEKNLLEYHEKLKGHIDGKIKTYGPNILIDMNGCPYREICNKDNNIPCIRKISLEHMMELSNIKDHDIEVENDCKIVIYKVPDRDIIMMENMIRELEELEGKINDNIIIEILSKEYQQSDRDHQ